MDLVKAKKRFGQNFLKDDLVLDKIIQSMPNDDLVVVEIGPGLGDLTKKLLQHKKVVAFEIDDELCEILRVKFSLDIDKRALELRCTDVLQHWEKEKKLLDGSYNLVANLPYYIATKIVLNLIKESGCQNFTVMLQKEVAYKFCANVGDKEYGAISILAELIGKRSIVCDVSPKSFTPEPKVTSSVLKIEKQKRLVGDIFKSNRELFEFEQFLKEAFKSPRKTLRKNLNLYPKEDTGAIFDKLQINPNTRPHQLSSFKYLKIFNELKDKDGAGDKKETKL